jgi:hypothetical protein
MYRIARSESCVTLWIVPYLHLGRETRERERERERLTLMEPWNQASRPPINERNRLQSTVLCFYVCLLRRLEKSAHIFTIYKMQLSFAMQAFFSVKFVDYVVFRQVRALGLEPNVSKDFWTCAFLRVVINLSNT